jgi:voltage-gated potassium channel
MTARQVRQGLHSDWFARSVNAMVVMAALATVPVIILEETGPPAAWLLLADWAIWCAFVAEYAIEITLAPSRSAYAKRNWLSVIVIVLSFPTLPALFSLARLARLLRLVGVTMRALTELQSVLARRGVMYVMGLSMIVVLAGGAALTVLEPQTVKGGMGDGIWWAIVTASTVGYGDIAPSTLVGRIIAVVLMLCGIGMVSTLAASITSYFVGQNENLELKELRERLARMEVVLNEIAERQRLSQ